ncbi:hypothetical protein [Actinomadura flavalba]|uniref:hypothetical protein n=1 Tax=Actinomadura flavalba TaxID=1120938 RepID=UPI00039ED2FE|nr:hypothetical protein [Actinomadura flavalba]
MSEHLNAVRKYVVSRTLTDPGWANSEILPLRLVRERRFANGAVLTVYRPA